MEPPAAESVKRMNPQLWTLGSSMICVKAEAHDVASPNSLLSWQDGNNTFHISPRDDSLTNLLLKYMGDGDSAIDQIHDGGCGGGVWAIGNEVICKVKSWSEERQLEATTIDFVRDNFPSVPLPEVLYSWIDRPFKRTYLLLKRVHARTLNAAWQSLSTGQRQNIANEMAEHCLTLAGKTSPRFESASGYGVLEHWLMGEVPESHVSWLPMTLGPFSGPEMKEYMSKISSAPVPDFDVEALPFFHCDLGPTNILVSDDGDRVVAIIDWESTAYFPNFWVATRPATNWAYRLSEPNVDPQDLYEWGTLFSSALVVKGFSCQDVVYSAWNKANTGPA
ncbi:hypothetical protein LOCC1_G004113 [Lachnellula occidentalis]|uniref:Aminoglycoside phosphotransferase domain-containing protein n=1 Tax=Lachnellula occidentalis TaxID=215460 RepID=A0A8H8S3R3_9HELO|nr:hypothetical protein LOCC1_G004113 [Lachnellula occidentalis]